MTLSTVFVSWYLVCLESPRMLLAISLFPFSRSGTSSSLIFVSHGLVPLPFPFYQVVLIIRAYIELGS